jgi:hypothetical protein
MKIQQRPGLAPGIAPHFARRRTSSGCMRRNAAASVRNSVRKCGLSGARSNTAKPGHGHFLSSELCTMAPERRCLLPWCQSSPVSVTARLERRSGPSGRCEQRKTPLRFVRLWCCSPASHALCWRRDECSPGNTQSRESLTQDSRSAVKARLIDPLRESFGERRCTPCKACVSVRSRRPSRGLEPAITRRNAA